MCGTASAETVVPVTPNTSVATAVAKVVRLRHDPAHARDPITVRFATGTYRLDQPVTLPPEAHDTTFEAAGGPVTFSGGRPVARWRPATVDGRPCWAADLPAGTDVRELWVDDARAQRARYPAAGTLKAVVRPDPTTPWNQGQDGFGYDPADWPAGPPPAGSEAVVCDRWTESRLPVASVDGHTIRSSRRTVFQLEDGDPYWLEGAAAWATHPGDWVLDRRTATLYYLPRPGQTPANTAAVYPHLPALIVGSNLSHVTFRGITFAHAEWTLPADVSGFAQAAVGVPAAVSFDHARDCRFERCTFAHLGTYGLELGTGSQRNAVDHCTFADLGGGGVKVGDVNLHPAVADQSFGNTVADCRLHDLGNLFPSGTGVWVGQAYDNRIEHNDLHDLFQTAIGVGWTWGYGDSQARGNVIEGNVAHHIGKRSDGTGPLTSDMGAVYLLGVRAGTVVRGNVFHDVAGRVYGGWGVYLDEGSTDVLVDRNLIYRTTHGAFHQNYGRDNVLRDNVFAYNRDAQVARTKTEPHTSFTFERNVVVWDTGELTNTWPDGLAFDRNLYYLGGRGTLTFAGKTWPQWTAAGEDAHSVVLTEQPFVDPAHDDFTLRPGVPAKAVGFEPLTVGTAGPR